MSSPPAGMACILTMASNALKHFTATPGSHFIVCNGFLSVNAADGANLPSAHRRSPSVTPSVRSSRSRITLVEEDPKLASYQDPYSHKSYDKTTTRIYAPRYTWFEHLLGLFCINVAAWKEPEVVVEGPENKKASRRYLMQSSIRRRGLTSCT